MRPFEYPAPGYRYGGNGTLYAIGQGGYSWSSSVPAGRFNARYLGFHGSWIDPQDGTNRAYGFQVRCLLE